MNWENSTWTNPLSELERKYSGQIQNLVANTNLSYEIVKNISFKTNLGYTSMSVDENIIYPLSSRDPDFVAGGTGFAYFGDNKLKTWIAEPQLDYKLKVSKGTLLLLLGSTFQESVQSGKTVEGSGFSNDALLDNIRAAATLNIIQAAYSKYRYMSGFARANFNWEEKYILNLTARRDGSSRFGPGNKFANFGAIGAAWIFSNEKFFPSGVFSFGKLRSSYGITGSDAIGDYQYLNTYGLTSYPYNRSTGLVINRLANPQYSWESNRKFEVALELAFLKDQISFEASYYQNRSTNQLVGLPLPIMTGQSSVQFNLPATVENTGFEFQVSSWLMKKSAFQWEANFNITVPSNRLIEFPGLEKFPAYANRYDVGKSVFTIKGFQSTGVDTETGLYTVADLNEDGAISSTLDIVGLKQIAQQYYGGLGNTFRYKGVDLTLFFQFVKQTGNSYQRSFIMPGAASNQPIIVLNRWQQPGDQTSVQRFSDFDPTAAATTAYSRSLSSDDRVTDASFIRFKTAALSWQLPTTTAQRVGMQKLRIYLQGQNLFTITNYTGLDPENQVSVSLPALRMITVGLDLTF
ncbi:MAG: TonB-dependent receptor [Cytophagales bacterium]|nr:TonB-dependent receptor [Cytophagales bacterium]